MSFPDEWTAAYDRAFRVDGVSDAEIRAARNQVGRLLETGVSPTPAVRNHLLQILIQAAAEDVLQSPRRVPEARRPSRLRRLLSRVKPVFERRR